MALFLTKFWAKNDPLWDNFQKNNIFFTVFLWFFHFFALKSRYNFIFRYQSALLFFKNDFGDPWAREMARKPKKMVFVDSNSLASRESVTGHFLIFRDPPCMHLISREFFKKSTFFVFFYIFFTKWIFWHPEMEKLTNFDVPSRDDSLMRQEIRENKRSQAPHERISPLIIPLSYKR